MYTSLFDLIEQNNYAKIRQEIVSMKAVDIATFFEEINHNTLLLIFRILPKDLAVDVFSYLPNDLQKYIIESSSDEEIKTILDKLFFDDTIDFIEEMPANIVKKILLNTNEETRKLINQFLAYSEYSAGSLMTIEYVDLSKEMTVGQALQRIKKTAIDKKTIETCYVLDDNRILVGITTLRKLILSEESALVKDIMISDFIVLNTNDHQEEVATLFKKYDYVVMPVVDSENRLVGIVTVDDVIDAIDQENTEDFQKMAAMQPSEKKYLKTNAFVLAKHRFPWLLFLMLSATFTGGIIMRYENALQSVLILTSFIPMLMDTGGNAGSQSSTLIIRGIALGEIRTRDTLKVLWKELQVSFLLGFILGLVNFIRIYLVKKVSLGVSITVCVTLFFTIIMAKTIGGILPILAKKIKLDPALMASPIITTIVDAGSLMLYFFIATKLLRLG
ncbi:MAG TPA: magnesium transporter [Treponemataceae bacterium]|nr:magnesium transporter [Treponemataceae bacterium]